MADASFYAAGSVLMINYIKDQTGKPMKTYLPASFGSDVFSPTHLKQSIYAKEFLAFHFAFGSFAHILWESTKPTIVSTHNRSLTMFFEVKTITSSLWSCVDQVLNFTFILGHNPGKAKLAADSLARIQINPDTKLELKVSSRLRSCEVEFNLALQSPDNSLNVVLKDSQFHEMLCAEPFSINALELANFLDEFHLTNENQTINLKAEQQNDATIRKVQWLHTKPPSPACYMSAELQKYHKQFKRLELHDGVLIRKFFGRTW